MKQRNVHAWFLIPSSYGLVMWGFTLGLYSLRLIDWDPGSTFAMALFLGVLLAYGLSAAVHYKPYTRVLNVIQERVRHLDALPHAQRPWHISDAALWTLHLLGLFGLGLYLREIMGIFGGFLGLLDVLTAESHLVRQAEIELVGIYFSYFGWMAIPLTVLRWRIDGKPPRLLLFAVALQLGGNLLFIDRTRPVWLVFASILILFPLVEGLAARRLLLWSLGIVGIGIISFFGIGAWIGKTGAGFDAYGAVNVNQELANLYYYLTSGFAYFEAMLDLKYPYDFVPQRSLYPLFKVGAMLGIVAEPPIQILPFIEAPFPANVGTFLEPFFADGGMVYVVLGVLASTFLVDFVALLFLRSTSPLAIFCWANLCFVSFISFFVPKISTTPVWLFLFVGIMAYVLRLMRPSVMPPMDSPVRPLASHDPLGPLAPLRPVESLQGVGPAQDFAQVPLDRTVDLKALDRRLRPDAPA